MYDKDKIDLIVKQVVDNVKNANSGNISLSLALALTEKVKQKASEMGVKAVIAVADAGANTISLQSMDGAYIASADIAVNKAFTVVSLKMPTKNLASLAAPGGSLYGIQFTNGGKIVIFGGGVPLYSKDGRIIGGIGISGGSADQDTALGDYAAEIFKTLI
ncbi:MAG: heme-binding protein [Clostridia bacterium]|nr:heme-binding protein [Clostridia bacterium]